MRNIILMLILAGALVAAGVGGAYAHFVDTETSEANTFETGSLDLRLIVDGELYNDPGSFQTYAWGETVPAFYNQKACKPGLMYIDGPIGLRNTGDSVDGKAYIRFKEAICYNSDPRCCDKDVPDGMKEEPELVAEQGGKVDCQVVDGVGVQGDNCCMKHHTYISVWTDIGPDTNPPTEPPGDPMTGIDGILMEDLIAEGYYVGDLDACAEGEVIWVWVGMMLPDYIEDSDRWDGDAWEDELLGWPTNAFALDRVVFDVEFTLGQTDSDYALNWVD